MELGMKELTGTALNPCKVEYLSIGTYQMEIITWYTVSFPYLFFSELLTSWILVVSWIGWDGDRGLKELTAAV